MAVSQAQRLILSPLVTWHSSLLGAQDKTSRRKKKKKKKKENEGEERRVTGSFHSSLWRLLSSFTHESLRLLLRVVSVMVRQVNELEWNAMIKCGGKKGKGSCDNANISQRRSFILQLVYALQDVAALATGVSYEGDEDGRGTQGTGRRRNRREEEEEGMMRSKREERLIKGCGSLAWAMLEMIATPNDLQRQVLRRRDQERAEEEEEEEREEKKGEEEEEEGDEDEEEEEEERDVSENRRGEEVTIWANVIDPVLILRSWKTLRQDIGFDIPMSDDEEEEEDYEDDDNINNNNNINNINININKEGNREGDKLRLSQVCSVLRVLGVTARRLCLKEARSLAEQLLALLCTLYYIFLFIYFFIFFLFFSFLFFSLF